MKQTGARSGRPDSGEIVADIVPLPVEDRSLAEVVEHGLGLSWTRDAFDRLIVAQAALDRAVLITRDRLILKNYSKAVW